MITVIRYGKLATFILFFITLIYSISHLFIENTNIFLRNIISILPIVNTFIYLLISIPISRLSNKYLRNFSIGEALVVLCMMLIYLEKPYFLLKNREYSVSIMVIIFLLLSIGINISKASIIRSIMKKVYSFRLLFRKICNAEYY